MSKDIHPFLKPRWILENLWPGCPYKVYDVLVQHESSEELWVIQSSGCMVPEVEKNPSPWPYLFRKLKWHERRTIEQLSEIRYAKVVTYVGYWVVGDVVPVKKFVFDGKEISFDLSGHVHPIDYITPETPEEYKLWKEKEKISH